MAFHNTNYEMVPLTGGTYTLADLGNGLTASTVHEIYCISNGSIKVTALGGGVVTFPMTAGQSVRVMAGGATVVSGSFVGFRAKFYSSGIGPNPFSS
jgi:hypothetical protein